jgi:molybdenum cofactor cytidylyltransferase
VTNNISAILLAAGESRRTGRQHKLLLEYNEKPLVRHVAEELLASNISECIVVIGCQAKRVKEALTDLPVRFIENSGFYSGMTSSIQEGVQNLQPKTEAFMVCLSDMPLLKAMHYNALIKKFESLFLENEAPILRPTYKESFGHPVLFHHSYKDEILACKNQKGCQEVLSKNRSFVTNYALANKAYYTDIDTIEDYYRLRE